MFRGMAMSETITINLEPLDRADRFFLKDGLGRGMSIGELAGFLNRSEDEIKSYCTAARF
jgi:hypothetical protein